MIRIITFIFVIIFPFLSYSQDLKPSHKNKDYYANFGIGYSIPTGNFSKKTVTNDSHGSANNGFAVYGRYGFKGDKYFGFNVAISVNSFSANTMIDTTFMNTELKDDVQLSTKVGNWVNINLMAGPSFNLSKRNSRFEISAFGGLAIANRPSIEHDFVQDGNLIWIYFISSGKGYSFYIRPEISYSYLFNGKYGLRLYLSYSYSKPTLNCKAEYPMTPNGWKTKDLSLTQKISSIDLGVCFVIKTN